MHSAVTISNTYISVFARNQRRIKTRIHSGNSRQLSFTCDRPSDNGKAIASHHRQRTASQAWRSKGRDDYRILLLKIDPHSPERFRVNGMLRNQPGFYGAFGVKPGDAMYLTPKDRVLIW